MLPSTYALLGGIVDYAGTFPPASLTLADALAEYARARAGDDAWLLGRLVVPEGDLVEFERLAPALTPGDQSTPWELSVIFTAESVPRLERVRAFNEKWRGKVQITSVEFAPVALSQIAALARAVPKGLEMFFEAPLDADLDRRLQAIGAAGAAAKVRTGGVTAAVFPTPHGLVRFVTSANEAGVAFKATAGLHHPVRGCYALTYQARSDTATMHGFLNLAVAATLVRTGGSTQEALHALLESSADAFAFRAEGLFWRGRPIAVHDLAETRRGFFRSFGSCAFQEPADDLRRAQVL